jgi:fibro-slime domain-containing protein
VRQNCTVIAGALLLVVSTIVLKPAHAASLTAYWYTVSYGDPDFYTNPNPCCGYVSNNEVQNTLGPNGYPVYNPSNNVPSPPNNMYANPLQDVNNVTGELTWWNPGLNSNVTYTGSSVLTLPISQTMFVPSGKGSSDTCCGFQTAILSVILSVPTSEIVTFNLGSDDDSFLAVGNSVVADVGGIHGDAPMSYNTGFLGPGDYTLTLFYADRHETGANLDFSVETPGVTLTAATPLPTALPLFAGGLGAVGLLCWRRKRRATVAS